MFDSLLKPLGSLSLSFWKTKNQKFERESMSDGF